MISTNSCPPSSALHSLLLLSDSALPLGSFAFSSGLESHISHCKTSSAPLDIQSFLRHSLHNTASSQLPHLLAAHASPSRLAVLDNALDAATSCVVARRASTSQGRALAGLWTRALRVPSAAEVDAFVSKGGTPHVAPLWGAVCAALGIGRWDTAYVFLLNHAKAVVSAGVRSGTLGPYQGQAILAGEEVRQWVEGAVRREIERIEKVEPLGEHDGDEDVAQAGVSVPAMDLWMGRHELLYSRIFNS